MRMHVHGFLCAVIVGAGLTFAPTGATSAQSVCPPKPCPTCEQHQYTDENGNLCCTVTCGPDYPQCAGRGRVCAPGASYTVAQCSSSGAAESCTYVCRGDGSGYDRRSCVAQPISQQRYVYCDFNASCPSGGAGVTLGKPVEVTRMCGAGGVLYENKQTIGACGDRGCRKVTFCQFSGQTNCVSSTTPAPQTTCTGSISQADVVPPNCSLTGGGASCDWTGFGMGSVVAPCGTVFRTPFPRGLVSVPNKLTLTGFTNPIGGAEHECRDPNTGQLQIASNGIFKIGSYLSWMSTGELPQWTMDERPWNIGKTNESGRTIANGYSGYSIEHVYETSSVDKPALDPAVSSLTSPRGWSAYQVQLRSRWNLSGHFYYQRREHQQVCYLGADPTQETPCGSGRGDIITTTRIISPVYGTTYYFGPQTFSGAITPQDPLAPAACLSTIPVPVLQAQSTLVR